MTTYLRTSAALFLLLSSIPSHFHHRVLDKVIWLTKPAPVQRCVWPAGR